MSLRIRELLDKMMWVCLKMGIPMYSANCGKLNGEIMINH